MRNGTNQYTKPDPRQERFAGLYYSPDSPTFSNCYRSAIDAGYSPKTAKDLSHNKPKWLSELAGKMASFEPDHLIIKLEEIVNDPEETTAQRLRAIELMMKNKRMLTEKIEQIERINIETVLK